MNDNNQRVAYLGSEGSYSYLAAQKYFASKLNYNCASSITEVLSQVTDGSATFGIVPIENSTTGGILETYDLLTKNKVFITGEVYVCIHHQLLVNPQANLSDVRVCYSHPQAIYQCQKFLQKHTAVEFVYTSDTATAALAVKKNGGTKVAAIASKNASVRYNLTIAQKNIEDNPKNFTRFAIVSQKPSTQGDKVTLILSLKHIPGSLYHAIEPIAKNSLNLTKIESRPISGTLWEYLFILDFELASKKGQLPNILSQIRDRTKKLTILGVYKKGKTYET